MTKKSQTSKSYSIKKRTTKDTETKIQLKRGHPPIKQKTRPIAYQLQKYVEKSINKPDHSGQLQKIQNVE